MATLDRYVDKLTGRHAWVLESEDSIASILEKGHLHPSNASIREQADAILNKLGSCGYLKYRDIWEKPFPAEATPES